jgi:TP901 family phage tail tape measure protein
MTAVFGMAAKTFAGFDDKMRAVKGVTGATADQFKMLTETAKELGRTTSFTSEQVGDLMLGLGRAGFRPDEINAATAAVMDLSRATGTEMAEATDIASGVLRAFNLEASEMTHVSDVLTATTNNSAQTLTDLGEAMKYAAPFAAEYGMTIEQASKAIGVMANFQIKGSMAGTAMRQAIMSIADPKVQDQLRGIGVEVLDSARKLRPFGDLFAELGEKMADMSNAERIDLMSKLFGDRAAGGALKLVKGQFDGLSNAIDNAGSTARRTSQEMDAGLGGAVRIFLSAVEGINIAIGNALQGPLKGWMDWFSNASLAVVKFVTENSELVTGVAAAGSAILAVGAGFLAFGQLATAAATAVGVLSAAMAFLAANPITVVIAGIVAATAAIAYFESTAQRLPSVMGEVVAASDKMRAGDQALLKELQSLSEKQSLSNDEMDRANSILDTLEGRYGDLSVSVDDATGKIEGMAGAQDKLNEAMKRAAVSQLKAEVQAMDSEIAIAEKQRSDQGLFANVGELFTSDEERMRQDQLELDKIMAQKARRSAILERIAAIEGGDAGALTGGAEAPVVSPAVAAAAATAQGPTLADTIDQDAFQRDVDAAIEADRQDKQNAADKAAANQSLADDTKRLQIEQSVTDEKERQRRLLEFEREVALRDVGPGGADAANVNAYYDARLAGIRSTVQQQAAVGPSGTFSTAAALAMTGRGGGTEQQRTAKATEETAKSVKTLAEIAPDILGIPDILVAQLKQIFAFG